MARTFIGIDLQTGGVAVVAASGGIKGLQVEAARYVRADSRTEFGPALSEAMASISVKGAITVVSVPAETVSFRHLFMPFNAPKKIRMVLPSEMEPLLPFPLDSVVIDAVVISKSTSEGNTPIMAAALQKTVLDRTLEQLKASGIVPDLIVPGGWVLGHAMAAGAQAQANWMIVDASGPEGMVVCGSGSKPYGIRGFRIPEGGGLSSHVFSEAQRTHLGLSERLAMDLHPEIVWINGTDADRLQAADSPFQAPVEMLNLGHDVKTHIRIAPEAGWDPMRMNGALALILCRLRGGSGLNFYKGGIGFSSFFTEHGQELKKLAAVAALTAVLGIFNVGYDSHLLAKKIANLDSRIKEVFSKTFPDVQKIVDPLQQMKVKIREIQESSGLETEGAADIRAIDIMEMISRDIPDTVEVEMTQLNFSEETVLLSGNTGNFNSVDEIKTSLEKNKRFSSVTIASANMEKSGERVEFKIKADLARSR